MPGAYIDEKVEETSRFLVDHKNGNGNDYAFVEQTDKEIIYRDSRQCSLMHTGKKIENELYIVEFEEKAKEPDCLFAVNLYKIIESGPLWIYSSFFDETVDHARAEAAKFFRSIRDT